MTFVPIARGGFALGCRGRTFSGTGEGGRVVKGPRASAPPRLLDGRGSPRRGLFAAVLAAAISLGTLSAAGATKTSGLPVITALSARSAVPGQTFTLSGTGFYSANGVIVASFGTHPAPTQCPTRERCLVTVPTRAKLSGVYQLRLRTESGTSNALSFKVS